MGWGVSTVEFLRAFAEKRWPDADVYMSPATGDFTVSVRVTQKQVAADRVAALATIVSRLTPRTVDGRRRRLYWGRRKQR